MAIPQRPTVPGGTPNGTSVAPAHHAAPTLPPLAPSPVTQPVQPTTPTAPAVHVPPASTAPGSVTYQQVGSLTSEMLLNGTPHMFAHLDAKIVEVRDWVQKVLTDQNQSDAISEARQGNRAKKAEVNALIDRLVLQYISRESVVSGDDRSILIASVINEITGLGPIEPLWGDPRITEVMVNGPDSIYVEISGRLTRVPGARFRDKYHLLEICQQILAPINRRVDQRNPLEDGRLADGSRVNIVHFAVAPGGPLLTIRRFPETVWTMMDLVNNKSISPEMGTEIAWLVKNKCSVLVVGGTGSGKTSLLNALSSCIPRTERVITIEDSLELRLHPQAHVAAMEARPAAASGEGEVTIRRLVKNALRQRPDRIVVGEVRDSSALDMLQAMNTGHEGSMTTLHANGAEEAVNRLAVLVAQGGEIGEDKVQWLIGDAVDMMIVQRRYEDGSRRVQGVYEVPPMRASTDGRLVPIPIWEWEQTGTDDNGMFVGEYVKRNEISEDTRKARRLDHAEAVTLDEIVRMSELPAQMQKGVQ